jgi:hypothetical protein
MAKPLGYGKIRVEILNVDEAKRKEYLRDFEAYMNAQPKMSYGALWHKAEQVVELVTMAQSHTGADLTYMPLKDHMLAKNNKDKDFNPKSYEALSPYSQLVKAKANIPTYCNPESVERMRRLIQEEIGASVTSNSIEEIITLTQKAKKAELEQSFLQWKGMLLNQMEARKAQIKEQERLQRERQREEEAAQRKAAEQEKAITEGFSLEGINFSKSTAFDQLVKAVETYARKRLGVNDNQLKKQFVGQYLAAGDHEELLQGLRAIFDSLNKKDRSRWVEAFDKNPPMRKVAEWIGEEKARAFLQTLQS